MKIILLLILAFTGGCIKEGQEIVPEQSFGDYRVQLLFSADGCNVYRFHDGGNSRYFTNCKGSTSWNEASGKSSRSVEISGGK